MRFNKFSFATVAVVSTLALPGLAQATSIYHPAPGEVGYTYQPDHFKSTKSRADVIAEIEAARKDGTLALMQRGAPLPIKNAGPAKTRQQVIDEMRSESPEQRRTRLELTTGG